MSHVSYVFCSSGQKLPASVGGSEHGKRPKLIPAQQPQDQGNPVYLRSQDTSKRKRNRLGNVRMFSSGNRVHRNGDLPTRRALLRGYGLDTSQRRTGRPGRTQDPRSERDRNEPARLVYAPALTPGQRRGVSEAPARTPGSAPGRI